MKIKRGIIISAVIIAVLAVLIGVYCNSRSKKYLPANNGDFGTHFLTAEKRILAKSGQLQVFTYRLALGFGNGSAGGKTGSILKDPDQWNMDYDPKAYKKAWVDLTPFETYLLFDLAEKYVNEDKFYYPENKNVNSFKKGFFIIEDEVQITGEEKHNYKVSTKLHETGFIYQIVVFLYFFHKYFWFIFAAVIVLAAVRFAVKKKMSVS